MNSISRKRKCCCNPDLKSLKSFSINHYHLLIFTNKNSSSILSFLLRTNQSLFIVPKTSVDNLPAPCISKWQCQGSDVTHSCQNHRQLFRMLYRLNGESILTETKDGSFWTYFLTSLVLCLLTKISQSLGI